MDTNIRARRGDWMQTFTGRAYWPLDPQPGDVDIRDIAHALSMMCRYGGHTNRFYSVAEHSVAVSRLLPREYAMLGLMHDATETYLYDLIRPVKRCVQGYAELEQINWLAIAERFDLAPTIPHIVHQADEALLFVEHEKFMNPHPLQWDISLDGNQFAQRLSEVELFGHLPRLAELQFLARFDELRGVK